MLKPTLTAVLATMFVSVAVADTMYTQGNFQTIYTETPVQSYYAYPDDPNFVPESEFMQRADSLNYDNNIMYAREYETMMNPGVIFAERPMVICRNFGCTRLNDKITRTFLFNSLVNIFMMNAHSRLYICEADPFSRSCLQSGISFPVRTGIANALIKVPKATISQVNVSTGLSKASVNMTYELLVNGINRSCEPTVMDIVIPNHSSATLMSREFACNMTSDGLSNVSMLVNLDYIDLDYGILGGYYSFGTQGPTAGGGTGYALFKTEYSTSGMSYTPFITSRTSSSHCNKKKNQEDTTEDVIIQPGEYAVGPLDEDENQ